MADAIRIGEPAIEVRLRRNARARRMVLRVGAGGTAADADPAARGARPTQARAFLSDHEGWLRRHIAARRPRRAIGDGSVLPFGDGTLTVRMRAAACPAAGGSG